mmetsp:Transcript_42198/g.99014  ORF Transcript_42198/g.99014 Transcript_42198/m.99014 type:complete len:112 (+) Transcript_42198:2732-3067(+)
MQLNNAMMEMLGVKCRARPRRPTRRTSLRMEWAERFTCAGLRQPMATASNNRVNRERSLLVREQSVLDNIGNPVWWCEEGRIYLPRGHLCTKFNIASSRLAVPVYEITASR